MIELPPFNYHRPATVAEACALLAQPGAVALAGGTDLMVHMRSGRRRPQALVSLAGLAELATMGPTAEGGWRIGARTDLETLMASADIATGWPVLVQAARYMGSPAVRGLATVGGNCCNASPAADLVPPLLVSDAVAVIAGAGDSRRVALTEFFTGPGTTVLQPGELLVAVELPARSGDWRTAFERLDHRRAMDIAVVSVAASLRWDGDRVADARVALGAVAPVPLRVPAAEAALVGRPLDADSMAAAAQAAMDAARPIADVRATAEYRRAMVRVLTRRAVHACAPEGDA